MPDDPLPARVRAMPPVDAPKDALRVAPPPPETVEATAAPAAEAGEAAAAPADAAPTPEAAKPALTTDLKTLADAANEAAKREATQWFFFVTIMITLAAIVGSTTHRVLFLEQPVQLPIFNVQVPLVGFYWLAPALLVVMHFYVLAQIGVMAGKVHAFLDAVEAEAGEDRAALRLALKRLDPFAVAQMLAAERLGEPAWALRAMAWTRW